MFTIHSDPASTILRVDMSGFLTLDEVQRFSTAEQEAARALTLAHGGFDLLIRTPDGIAQSQEVMTAFFQMLGQARYKARSIAIVAERPLLRMQLRRVFTVDHVGIFAELAEANDWLIGRRVSMQASA